LSEVFIWYFQCLKKLLQAAHGLLFEVTVKIVSGRNKLSDSRGYGSNVRQAFNYRAAKTASVIIDEQVSAFSN